jgi:uncharacterized membrane protein
MKKFIIAYVAALVVMFALDFIWLSLTGERLYRRVLGDMLLDSFRVVPAVLFYVLYVVGVVIFAVAPALTSHAWPEALVRGALFGFFAYMTYDLTNQATLKNWSITVTLADMAWGAALTATGATAGYLAASYASD